MNSPNRLPDRVYPPLNNLVAEQALLGAILANNEVWHRVTDRLKPEHFGDALHARIYEACGKLIGKNLKADAITLRRLFDQDGALTDIGGGKYLVELGMAVVSIRDADDYAAVIIDLSYRRKLVDLAQFIMEEARIADADRTAKDVMEAVEAQLSQISASDQHRMTLQSAGDAAYKALRAIERARRQGFGGLSTGLRSLDRKLGGLHESDLIVLAGRPSMGKTALASKIADNRAFAAWQARQLDPASREAGAVFFASLEMSAEELSKRHMAWRSNVSTFAQRDGYVKDAEWERLVEAQQALSALPLFIDDQPAMTPAQVQSRARKIQRREGLSLIVIDYIQLMTPTTSGYRGNRVQEVSEITRDLKNLAKELKVPVIALSQLSRKVEDRDDKRPQLADLRESGSIEQDADAVAFAYRDEYYLGRSEPKRHANESDGKYSERYAQWESQLAASRGIAEVIVAKNRQGPIGTARLQFQGETTSFTDLAHDDHANDDRRAGN